MYHYANCLNDKESCHKYLQTSALIFDQYPAMMKRVLKNFSPDEKTFKKLVKQLKSKHRKETLWVMKSLKEHRIDNEPLKEIYKLKPNSLRLEVLLTRHIHKIESSFLKSDIFFQHEIQQKIAFEKENKSKKSNKNKSFWQRLKKKYHQLKNKLQNKKSSYHKQALLKIFEENKILIIRDLMTFIDSSLKENKVRTPELWYLYSGYLKIFLGEYEQANQSFQKGLKICKKDKIKNQISLLQNLLDFTTKDKISPKLENKLYQNIKWAKQFIHKKYNNHSIYDSIFVIMAKKYLHENQLAQSYFCLSKIDYPYLKKDVYNSHATSYDLEQFIVYLQKKKKTKWDRFLLEGNFFYKNILNYTAGIKELQNLNYKKSLSYLQKIKENDSFWKTLKDNVNLYYFPGVITAYFGNGGAFPYRFVDNPISFVKKIISIQKQRNLSKAEKNYQIGKMFYDQSRWIRDDIHWDGKISKAGSDWGDEYNYYRSSRYNGFKTRPNFAFNFLNLSDNVKKWNKKNRTQFLARIYFDKFLEESNDKEKKAKVVIFNFHCQNGFMWWKKSWREKPEDLNFRGNPKYYKMLHEKYSDTDYYKEFIKECALFRKYINKNEGGIEDFK